MQKFIALSNIERFQRLIAREFDDANRARLERMLLEEQEKLRACDARPESVGPRDRGGGESRRQRQ